MTWLIGLDLKNTRFERGDFILGMMGLLKELKLVNSDDIQYL
jgi:hypothetical protein